MHGSPGLTPPGSMPPGASAGVAGAPGGDIIGGPTLPSIDEMDLSITCNPEFLRPTAGKLLNSQGLSNAAKIPLGVICKPMAGMLPHI